jgi:ketosteroid isomerase-like protein
MRAPIVQDGHQAPDEAEAAFYAAFATTDLRAMDRVWQDGEDAVCIHPGGALLLGKPAVMQSWAEILGGTAPPRIDYRLLNRIAAPGLEIHLVEESIRAGADPDARPNRVIATNVYAQGAAGWRMTVHHASLPLMARRGTPGSGHQLH